MSTQESTQKPRAGLKKPTTEAQVRDLPTPAADQVIGLGDSLYLRVRAGTGSKSFVIRKRTAGKWSVTTLGAWPQWSLQRARAAALAPTSTPVEKLTFGKSTEQFCREVIEARYRSSPEESTAYFSRDGAALSAVRLSALTRGRLIEAIKKKAETAPNGSRKMLALWKQWSKWAVLHDHMTTDLLGVVTVSNIGLPPPQSRDRVLTPDELAAVLTGTGRDARLLRFCLATGCRVGEALGLTADQVDDRVWTIPITKNGDPLQWILASRPFGEVADAQDHAPQRSRQIHHRLQPAPDLRVLVRVTSDCVHYGVEQDRCHRPNLLGQGLHFRQVSGRIEQPRLAVIRLGCGEEENPVQVSAGSSQPRGQGVLDIVFRRPDDHVA